MSQTARLFIAIPLTEPVKAALLAVSKVMGRQLPDGAVRWVRREQLHLTLRFLGETAVSQLPALQAQLTQLTSQHHPFTLQLNGVGAFPNQRKPRVLWADLAGQLDALHALKAGLDERLLGEGWLAEKRPFNPHLTLGRVKHAEEAAKLNWDIEMARLTFGVTEVQLVQSELRPSGPIYTVRHVAQLA